MPDSPANALGRASSSYLRSAAHQPIQWHEWGEEAFARARAENKPILLDVGAVWCHWCHVMDRESYENADTARVINENYIAIKVDRDERPDVDSRYQAAVQAISGQGGWPLTAFLTPDGKPFFGGTYFPPNDQYGRPGFPRVLNAIAQAYREKHDEVIESAEAVMGAISQAESFAGRSADVATHVPESMVRAALEMFDRTNGGFGQAPKFPHPGALDLCIDRFARTGNAELKTLIVTTLERMAKGGVYDQLAGGFHRYSVDEHWIVPHFEKMSYDNSELLKNYVHAFQTVGEPFFASVARDIIRWMDEWLSDRERGGFYASQDADVSLDDDGDYFTWTLTEAKEVLNESELAVAAMHYDIGEVGEMHHDHEKNVLFVRAGVADIAARTGIEHDKIRGLLDVAKEKMYAARRTRPTPYVDKTVYVNWNALCISAYLEAARTLDLPETQRFALKSLDRILAEAWDEKSGLRHVICYPGDNAVRSELPGLLDDYCFTVSACVDAYETTSDLSYYKFALKIAETMIDKFCDRTSGGFFDAPQNGNVAALGALSARRKPFQDSPTPAGNPAAAIALLRLFHYSNDTRYREVAEQTLETFAGVAEQFGIFGATYGLATLLYSLPATHVVILGDGNEADALARAALEPYAIHKSVLRLRSGQAVAENLPPALAQTIPHLPAAQNGKATAILCSGMSCKPPITEVKELAREIELSLKA